MHYIKTASTGCAKRTGAGLDHLLIGTVALSRMGKHVPVAEHHFRHPGAPRCGQGRHPALFRLLARRPRAGPGGSRLAGHPFRAGGSALGRWACRYRLKSLYKLIQIALRAKVNVSDPPRRGTSQGQIPVILTQYMFSNGTWTYSAMPYIHAQL